MYRVTKKFTAQDAFSDSIQYIIIAGTKLNYRVNTVTNILQISILDDNETEIAVWNNFNIDRYLKYEDDGVKECDEEVIAASKEQIGITVAVSRDSLTDVLEEAHKNKGVNIRVRKEKDEFTVSWDFPSRSK